MKVQRGGYYGNENKVPQLREESKTIPVYCAYLWLSLFGYQTHHPAAHIRFAGEGIEKDEVNG